MSSRRIKIIYNPKAKGGRSKKIAKKVEKHLLKEKVDYIVHETTYPMHAHELAMDNQNGSFDVIAALGGDGTVHEVGNAIVKTEKTLAVIPGGSGNDFAGGIGIKTWEASMESLVNGKILPISVIKAGDRYAINAMDAGFGGDVAKASEKHLRWVSGSKKYTLLTMALLTRHKPYKVNIEIDGQTNEWNLNLFVAGFGQTFGSGMHILPDARYNQEKMKIALIHDTGRLKFLRIFPKVFSAKHVEETNHVKMMEATKVTLFPSEDNAKPLRSEADGELFWDGEISIEVIPKALNVLVPENWNYEDKSLKIKK